MQHLPRKPGLTRAQAMAIALYFANGGKVTMCPPSKALARKRGLGLRHPMRVA